VQAWRTHFWGDIDLLESVQRRATKLKTSISNKSYEDGLRYLNLTTLETRWLRWNLIEVIKIVKGFDNLDTSKFCELSKAHTRGHSLKLAKPIRHLDIRKFSIAQCVVDIWNSLNNNLIACDSINGFKNRLDTLLLVPDLNTSTIGIGSVPIVDNW